MAIVSLLPYTTHHYCQDSLTLEYSQERIAQGGELSQQM
jgi:hypothetical protein